MLKPYTGTSNIELYGPVKAYKCYFTVLTDKQTDRQVNAIFGIVLNASKYIKYGLIDKQSYLKFCM